MSRVQGLSVTPGQIVGYVNGRAVRAIAGGAPVLEELRTKRDSLSTELDTLLAVPLPEDRAAADEANNKIKQVLSDRDTLAERVRVMENEEVRRRAEADAAKNLPDNARQGGAKVIREPKIYDPHQRHSYFLDMARTQLGQGDGDGGVGEARSRLERHTKELEVDLPAREARRDELAFEQTGQELRRAGYSRSARDNAFEKRVNPNRTDGQGGFFVPPLWLVDEYIDLPRFGRAIANMCKTMALPTGTDSINLPAILTGTATAVQTADAGGVQSTDMTDTSVSAPVRTIAGQQDIAIQLLDQSPVSFDEIVLADLIADYNQKLDIQCINGSGAAGQVQGILGVAGINAITYTDATPTLAELWVPLLQSASKVATGRVLPATATALTPSMWYWALSQLDANSRPLILPNATAFNNLGSLEELQADGPAGTFTFGLPAVLDGNIPSNLGGGTNETRAITARWSDLYLWEGSMRTRVLSEVLSGTLQVRLQVYNYVAFMPHRRPKSISVISGTGMIPAAGF